MSATQTQVSLQCVKMRATYSFTSIEKPNTNV